MKKLLAPAIFAGVLATQVAPAHAAVNCLAIGAQACLNTLDAFINSQSFVEAWATGAYNLYKTRNCLSPSSTATYTFYGVNLNKSALIVDEVVPNVSCQECDALSQFSSQLDNGYLGECSATNDNSWTFTGHFCASPAPQGAFVQIKNLTLYQAATWYLQCGNGPATTKSACTSEGGCLR